VAWAQSRSTLDKPSPATQANPRITLFICMTDLLLPLTATKPIRSLVGGDSAPSAVGSIVQPHRRCPALVLGDLNIGKLTDDSPILEKEKRETENRTTEDNRKRGRI
jgi:hypothetical protein